MISFDSCTANTPAASRSPTTWRRARELTVAVLATALIALCAHISVALPFTPVPVTMQTFAVLLVGMLLGPSAGAITMVFYLAEGAAGLPVFSPHGIGGLGQLFGPSAGYLLAYPLAALLAGRIFSAAKLSIPTFFAALGASLVADSVILLSGSAWLMLLLHQSPLTALELGMLPFLIGEACKVTLLAGLATLLQYPPIKR